MPEHDQLLDAIGELKSELKAQGMTLNQVLEQARRTNGRVNALEDWRHSLELREAHEAGLMEGAGTAAVTKGQLRIIIGSATALASLAGAIAGIVVKLTG